MAQINITYDTKTKKCSVLMDGQSVDNLTEVRIYKYEYINSDGIKDEESHIDLRLEESFEDGSIHKVTKIYASKNDDKQLSIDDFETYVKNNKNSATAKLANWLTKTEEN